ncbi:MAG: hypothetical protein K8U57_08970 [Planctomycetes bacterium]|nr:hypothetical protein [Planctomycetota bacterium]
MFALTAKPPACLTDAILAGLKDQCPQAGPPVRLQVRPHLSTTPCQCYAAVAAHLEGLPAGTTARMLFGWLLWEFSGVLLILEHHAVAEVDGVLLDVARHLYGETEVVFAPDPATAPLDNSVANRFAGLSGSSVVRRIAQLKRRNTELEQGEPPRVFTRIPEWQRNDAEVYRLLTDLQRPNARERAKRRKRVVTTQKSG